MESSESHEPSYYEVALTNRQVLIAFVVLCVWNAIAQNKIDEEFGVQED